MSDLPPIPMVDLSDPELAFFPYRFVLDLGDFAMRDAIRLWVFQTYGDDVFIATGNQFWFVDPDIAMAFKLRWCGGTPA